MTKLAPEWVRTSDPVIRCPARYRWTTAPALTSGGGGGLKAAKLLTRAINGMLVWTSPNPNMNCTQKGWK